MVWRGGCSVEGFFTFRSWSSPLTERPPIKLTRSIVSAILFASEDSSRILIDLVDPFPPPHDDNRGGIGGSMATEAKTWPTGRGRSFWWSLRYNTRLALSLFCVNGQYPLLRERVVREWALERLQVDIDGFHDGDAEGGGRLGGGVNGYAIDGEREGGDSGVMDVDMDTMRNYARGGRTAYDRGTERVEDTRIVRTASHDDSDEDGGVEVLPTEWLREICVGALTNAGCDVA